MKICAIGDIHGRLDWQLIPNLLDYDKIVFIGDYFDSFEIPYAQQMNNFFQLVQLKKDNPDKVELLIGNHDLHYLDISETYSGFQAIYANQIREELKSNLDLLKVVYSPIPELLFIHAGLSKTWVSNITTELQKYKVDFNYDVLNELINDNPAFLGWRSVRSTEHSESFTGDNVWQGPMWIRPNSLISDKLDRVIQVVGHTSQRMNYTGGIWFVDSLYYGQYLEVIIKDDGILAFDVKNINY